MDIFEELLFCLPQMVLKVPGDIQGGHVAFKVTCHATKYPEQNMNFFLLKLRKINFKNSVNVQVLTGCLLNGCICKHFNCTLKICAHFCMYIISTMFLSTYA